MHLRLRFVYVRLSLCRFVVRYHCQIQGIILVPGFFVIFTNIRLEIPRLSMNIRAVLTFSTVCAKTLQLLKGQVPPVLCSNFHVSPSPMATVHSLRPVKLSSETLGTHLALEVVGSGTEIDTRLS
jgi:hypothetical protein